MRMNLFNKMRNYFPWFTYIQKLFSRSYRMRRTESQEKKIPSFWENSDKEKSVKPFIILLSKMNWYTKTVVLWTIWSDLELKQTPNWKIVCSFSMATNKTIKSEDGTKTEYVNWHNIVVWWKAAETICEYLKKWDSLFVEWENRTRSWDAEDGAKRYRTEIIVDTFTFVWGGKKSEDQSEAPDVEVQKTKKAAAKKPVAKKSEEISIEDIPF